MKHLICAMLLISFGSASAELVTYRIAGELTQTAGAFDVYNIDGAKFEWIIVADRSVIPTPSCGTSACKNFTYESIASSQVTFSERPLSIIDQSFTATASPYSFQTNNFPDGDQFAYLGPDTFLVHDDWQIEGFGGLKTGSFLLEFDRLWYEQPSYNPLPSAIPQNSISTQSATAWIGNNTAYTPDSWSVTVVPLPAAAWMFGSGLGLLGWFRRKS